MLGFLYLFFKDLGRILSRSLLYVLIVVVMGYMCLHFWTDAFAEHFTAENAYYLTIIRYASIAVWIALYFFAAIMIVYITCGWFGEDVLTNRSYLNHLVPVFAWEHVFSKALAGFLVLSSAIILMSINIVYSLNDIVIVRELLSIIPDIKESEGLNFELEHFIKLGVYFLLMSCTFLMASSFLSLVIGQTVSKGVARVLLIFTAFCAVIFISAYIVIHAVHNAGLVFDFGIIKNLQATIDFTDNFLNTVNKTNLVLSLVYIFGAGVFLTYRTNV